MRFRYGIEPDEYEQMFIVQDYKCVVCGKLSGDTKGTRLHVDHDHETNKVRELICSSCNRIAGTLEFNPERTLEVIQYLRKHKSNALARLELMLRETETND
jgi:hypothetical protein